MLNLDDINLPEEGDAAWLDKLGFPNWMDSGDRNVSIP